MEYPCSERKCYEMKKSLIWIFVIGLVITVICAVGAVQQFKIEHKKQIKLQRILMKLIIIKVLKD